MPSEQDTDSHREEAKEGECMPITIDENTDEAIDTFARLLTLGHFAKAANLFVDVLKPYLDELPVFAEYANFLVQQGRYGVLLDRVNERISTQADVELEEDETVYLELLRALSMLHFEGQLMKVLDALETRSDFYSTLIKSTGELNYIQIRLVQTYLAIITAVTLVTPKWAIEYTHKIIIKLSGKKTYVLETGAAATSDSPWVQFQDWCILLGKEHPQEAVNVFRTLMDVLPAHRTTFSWVSNFIGSISSPQRGPLFILAKIGAINTWMSFRHRHHLRTMTVPDSTRDKTTTGAGDLSIEQQETSTDSGDEAVMEEEEAAMDTEATSRLLDELYGLGYDARSQQVIELNINKMLAGRRDHRLKLRDLADLAREEANYRLESYCFQLMVEMGGNESMFFAVSPVLEFSRALYSHIAQDAVELVNFLDRLFPNPLHTAVSIGSLATARLLLERGDESWALDEQGLTCMHQAAFKGYEAIARLFLEHDRNLLSCVDENGYLPLHVAAENGRHAILRLFLDSDKEHVNAQVQKETHGDERHHAEKYKKLGRLRKSSDEAGQRIGTALHLAAANGHEETVTSLLQCEATVDEEDVKGWTALHKASARWQYGVANILLRHGAKVDSKTKDGLTAIELATKSGHTALVDLLLQHHAEVSGADRSGGALRFSAEIGDLETAILLLDHEADVEAKGDSGFTALHLAAKNGHTGVVKFLRGYGADIEAKGDSGITALHLAAKNGRTDVVKFLRVYGADIEAKGDSGITALHLAAKNGHTDVVEVLLKSRADIKAKDNDGNTALHLAKEAGNLELAYILLENEAHTRARYEDMTIQPGELRAATIASSFLKGFDPHGLNSARFLPRGEFARLVQRNVVEATIMEECGRLQRTNVQRLVQYSIENPRLFLICVLLKKISSILFIRAAGLTDGILPVEGAADAPSIQSSDRKQTWHWDTFRNEHGPWDWDDKNRFLDYQWFFSAVTFDYDKFSFKISKRCPLPYTYLERTTSKGNQSYFGEVRKVGLLKEHLESRPLRFPSSVNHPGRFHQVYLVAVKKVRIEGVDPQEVKEYFNKEKDTLRVMRNSNHEHLIGAIAAYEVGTDKTDKYFVFPWATGGNLREFWDDRAHSTGGSAHISWALHQMAGLAGGLAKMHEHDTRHGDIKPENILIFSGHGDSRTALGMRTLVLSDVGIAKFHADHTSKRQELGYATTNKFGTLRYEPPEMELRQGKIFSDKIDPWSMGCVLLEFVIWLLHGSLGQDSFNTELVETGPKLNRFWDVDKERIPYIHPVAKSWITKLRQSVVKPSALRDLLDLIESRLLVGDVNSRADCQEMHGKLLEIELTSAMYAF